MAEFLDEEQGIQVIQRLMLAILNSVRVSKNVGIPESLIRGAFLQRGMEEASYNFLLFSLLEKQMLIQDSQKCLTITAQGIAFSDQLMAMRRNREIPDPPAITFH